MEISPWTIDERHSATERDLRHAVLMLLGVTAFKDLWFTGLRERFVA
jgi:hypothetical protein